jgi:hypothetical protein
MWPSKRREKKAVTDIQGCEHSDLVETVVYRTANSRLKENGPRAVAGELVDRTVVYGATRISRADFLAQHDDDGYRLAWKARDTESYLFVRS